MKNNNERPWQQGKNPAPPSEPARPAKRQPAERTLASRRHKAPAMIVKPYESEDTDKS